MKIGPRVLCLGVLAALAVGCSPPQREAPAGTLNRADNTVGREALVQFSLLAALAAADYEGVAPLRAVLAAGDFGLGTFDKLDGEMIVLDGTIYQALADGSVRPANLDGGTPFAAVTMFDDDGQVENLTAPTLDDLNAQLARALPRRNVPYALRIAGQFREITLRSVPAQSPPYRPLVAVTRGQPTWRHRNLRGTLVGLRCPSWIGTLNVSGYHWHFLSDDKNIGGHVLACALERGTLRFDECSAMVIRLPESTAFDAFDGASVSEQDIDAIERQRAPSR